MEIAKIYLRSIFGIVTAGIVTVLVGVTTPMEIMLGFYGAIGIFIYLDKCISD